MKTEIIQLNKITAEEGYVFKSKESGEIIGNVIYLGKNDSADNYEEVESADKE